jgi:2-oxoglutarate dehydrogenase E1 component
VVCGGKVYYDLVEEAQKQKLDDVALVRVEQLYPFPRTELTAELKRFAGAAEVVWCQEEPQNQGAWYQIQHHLRLPACSQAIAQLCRPLRVALARRGPPSPNTSPNRTQLVADALVNPP